MNGNLKTSCMLHEEYFFFSEYSIKSLSVCFVYFVLYHTIYFVLFIVVNITQVLLFKITQVLKCFKVSLIICEIITQMVWLINIMLHLNLL